MNYLIVDNYNETHSKSILEYIFKKYISGQKSGTISLDDIYSILTIENNREEEYSEAELTESDFSDLVRLRAYPQNPSLNEEYRKASDAAGKSAVLQKAYTQGGYIYLNINPSIQTNYRIQLNTLNNKHSLAVMKTLYEQKVSIHSAKFYARSPQCDKPLKVDKVLIYFDQKQLDTVAEILKSVTGLYTLEALPPFCQLAQTNDRKIYFGMAAEELPGESSFSLERSKDVFHYLTGDIENRMNVSHRIKPGLFLSYDKDPVGFVNSCFDYVKKLIVTIQNWRID